MFGYRMQRFSLEDMIDLLEFDMLAIRTIDFESIAYTTDLAELLLENIKKGIQIWLRPIYCVKEFGVISYADFTAEILCLKIMRDFLQDRLRHIAILSEDDKKSWRKEIIFNVLFLNTSEYKKLTLALNDFENLNSKCEQEIVK